MGLLKFNNFVTSKQNQSYVSQGNVVQNNIYTMFPKEMLYRTSVKGEPQVKMSKYK